MATTTSNQNALARPKRDLRAMRIAARDGDHNAAKALLRLFNFDEFAREITPGKPYSKRVRKAIDALHVPLALSGKNFCCPNRRRDAVRLRTLRFSMINCNVVTTWPGNDNGV